MAVPAIRVPIIALDKFTAPIRLFTQRINSLTRPIDDISAHMGKLHRAWNGLGAALSRPLRQTGIFSAGRFLGRGIGGIGHMLTSTVGLLGVASVGGAAAGIFGLTKRTSEFAEELDRSAFRLGTTVEGLQKLRYAAKMSDIDIEKFDTSMGFLTKSMGAALSTDKKKAGLFSTLGVDLKKTKDTKNVVLQMADAINKISNVGLRNKVLSELFGARSGLFMSSIFRGGRAEIEGRMKERESFGLITQKDIDKSQAFEQEWKKFGFVLEGIRNTFGLEMMPKFTAGIISLKGLLIENMPRIKSTFSNFAGYFTKERALAFVEYAKTVGGALVTIIKLFETIAGVSEYAGKKLSQALQKRQELYVYDKTSGNIIKAAPKFATSNPAGGGYGVPGGDAPYIQRQRAAAAAASIAPKNSVITEKNQAVLQIKILQDGKVQPSMIGGLGENINLGWSMVQ